MHIRFPFALLGTIVFTQVSLAQHQEVPEKPELWRGKQQAPVDTASLLHAFKSGTTQGHLRYFFMATDNAPGYRDYHAHALGGGIKLETARFHGFQFGISGFFAFNVGSSNLAEPDPKSGQMNRYELGLFDVSDPANKTDIDRLEELYIKYSNQRISVTAGRQLINTPFINLQDGRMRPTEAGGLWVDWNPTRRTRIEGGWLNEISPRSTVRWYSVAHSIGVYAQGMNPDGTRSDYAGNLRSAGIFMAGVTQSVHRTLSLKAWHVMAENIFHSTLLQADWKWPITSQRNWVVGAQAIRQWAIGHGGNPNAQQTFMARGASAQTFGFRGGLEDKRWNLTLNYNRITDQGRYLMPREWGRDPFFTFLPRERSEGLANADIVALKGGLNFPKARTKFTAGYAIANLPDVKDVARNKYGLPSYQQLNLDLRHNFSGAFKGWEAQLLWLYKGSRGNTHGEGRYVINKVNMQLWNLVFNFHF